MKKLTTQKGRRLIFWVIFVGVAIVAALTIIDPVGTAQRHNMVLARSHGEMLLAEFKNNPEFVHVDFMATTSEDLVIVGFVASSNALEQLHVFVEESQCPRTVKWRVNVEPLLFEIIK